MTDDSAAAAAQRIGRHRRILGIILVIAIAVMVTTYVRLLWRDITLWSRSVTFEHGSQPFADCIPRALPDLAGVTIRSADGELALDVPGQEGARVKATDEPGVARIVVFGHSASISKLGPPAEEPVAATLRDLKAAFSANCGSP